MYLFIYHLENDYQHNFIYTNSFIKSYLGQSDYVTEKWIKI